MVRWNSDGRRHHPSVAYTVPASLVSDRRRASTGVTGLRGLGRYLRRREGRLRNGAVSVAQLKPVPFKASQVCWNSSMRRGRLDVEFGDDVRDVAQAFRSVGVGGRRGTVVQAFSLSRRRPGLRVKEADWNTARSRAARRPGSLPGTRSHTRVVR